jgi:hypothetical protein
MCLIKDGLFSPIRLFCHKYIETKRKSAKSDCDKATHKLCFLAKNTESYRVGSHKIKRIM